MLSGKAGQSDDRVGIDADQASRGADAAALVEVLEHSESLVLGEMAVKQGRALAFGEAVFAGLAVEQSDVVLFPVASAGGKIAGVALTVEGAVGVLAAEAREIVHAEVRSESRRTNGVKGTSPMRQPFYAASLTSVQ
jgi:hypothetical protein